MQIVHGKSNNEGTLIATIELNSRLGTNIIPEFDGEKLEVSSTIIPVKGKKTFCF